MTNLENLRGEWIKERDKYPYHSREWWHLHFGIYALDEAIETQKAKRIWRYKQDARVTLPVGIEPEQ